MEEHWDDPPGLAAESNLPVFQDHRNLQQKLDHKVQAKSRLGIVLKVLSFCFVLLFIADLANLGNKSGLAARLTHIDAYLQPLDPLNDATLVISYSRKDTRVQSYLHSLTISGSEGGTKDGTRCSIFGLETDATTGIPSHTRGISSVVLDK